jgi:putative ABC transport system ATP-binding protein
MQAMGIVSIRSATKSYHLGNVEVQALRGVSLEVQAGEFMSIAGPSGSGKTTLLNLIGCVDVPTKGTVEVAGQSIGKLSERELTRLRLHTIGFIFQSFNLVNVLNVFRNVELPLLLQHVLNADERNARVLDLLTKVGLRDFVKHRPGELSGGQRQRVAIANRQPRLGHRQNHPRLDEDAQPRGAHHVHLLDSRSERYGARQPNRAFG